MTKRCDGCRFFHANPPASRPGEMTFSADGVRGGGFCRRNPPLIGREYDTARFPIVPSDCWCGEYRSRKAGVKP